eukprot:823130-Pyramimonas_sp.AAC.1
MGGERGYIPSHPEARSTPQGCTRKSLHCAHALPLVAPHPKTNGERTLSTTLWLMRARRGPRGTSR